MIIAGVNNSVFDDTLDNINNILELIVEAGTNDTDFIIMNNPINKLGDDLIVNLTAIKNNSIYLDEIKKYCKEYAIGIIVFYYDDKLKLSRLLVNHRGLVINDIGINICNELMDNSICFIDVKIDEINVNRALIINEKNIVFYNNGIKDITDKNNLIIYSEF